MQLSTSRQSTSKNKKVRHALKHKQLQLAPECVSSGVPTDSTAVQGCMAMLHGSLSCSLCNRLEVQGILSTSS
jgi:hypothetical protein